MKRTEMITIDGSVGEGGGQILRTSLSLSLVTGKPFRIVKIRAGRSKPGLLRQHLTAVKAAVEIGDAVADGAELGSQELVFRPERIRSGHYRLAVGTAGSTMLVLQTVLPALMGADAPSSLLLEGGTHNPFAPPYDFLVNTFLPILRRFGPAVEARLLRPGFFPAGGGKAEITITPVPRLNAVELFERGNDLGRRAVVHVASISKSVVERALEQIQKRLRWPSASCEIVEHRAEWGPGFVVHAEVSSEHVVETFSGFGERGVSAERVADQAIDQVRSYLAASAPAGEYLTDQLMLPLALAGEGGFRSVGLSRHAETNLEVIQKFLEVQFDVSPVEGGGCDIRVKRI